MSDLLVCRCGTPPSPARTVRANARGFAWHTHRRAFLDAALQLEDQVHRLLVDTFCDC
jgi:hypothetical protein